MRTFVPGKRGSATIAKKNSLSLIRSKNHVWPQTSWAPHISVFINSNININLYFTIFIFVLLFYVHGSCYPVKKNFSYLVFGLVFRRRIQKREAWKHCSGISLNWIFYETFCLNIFAFMEISAHQILRRRKSRISSLLMLLLPTSATSLINLT